MMLNLSRETLENVFYNNISKLIGENDRKKQVQDI